MFLDARAFWIRRPDWVTKGADGSDVMMGDLVLLEQEVSPVMSALLDKEIDVTAKRTPAHAIAHWQPNSQ